MSLPPPVSPLLCTNPDCGLPQGGRCAQAATIEDPLRACPDLVRDPEAAAPESTQAAEQVTDSSGGTPQESEPAPWSGRHLTLADAGRVMGSSPCRVITIVGPYDSGKTSFLTSVFLQMANGGARSTFDYAFAGSSSLHGLSTLAKQADKYRGAPGEQVVDHTTYDEPDDAGMFLHFALRPRNRADERVVNLLLSDIPGEWFDNYAANEDERARRRLPFLPRCDGFIVLADSAALLADGGQKIDDRTMRVLRRLSKNLAEWERAVPVVLLLSKYDQVWSHVGDPPTGEDAFVPANWGKLGLRLRRSLGAMEDLKKRDGTAVRVMAISAVPRPLDQGQPIGVIDPLAWMFEYIDRRHIISRPQQPIREGAPPFMTMRREHVR
jgi:hypothetical protein